MEKIGERKTDVVRQRSKAEVTPVKYALPQYHLLACPGSSTGLCPGISTGSYGQARHWHELHRVKKSEVGGLRSEIGGQMSKVGNYGMDIETKQIKSAKDLRVYKKAYALAMEIFNDK